MKTLECSSKGDTRFSAFYAKVSINGKVDTIENWYQLSKRFNNEPAPTTWKDAKGRNPDYFVVDGIEYDPIVLNEYYDSLWFRYLDINPRLVEFLRGYDKFTDIFAQPGHVNQASAIDRYIHGGLILTFELPPLRVAIVGSREYPLLDAVALRIRQLPSNVMIVSGGAIGVDTIAEVTADALGIPKKIFPVSVNDWAVKGKKAGFQRNQEIIGFSDMVIAFWTGKTEGSGTYQDITLARQADKVVETHIYRVLQTVECPKCRFPWVRLNQNGTLEGNMVQWKPYASGECCGIMIYSDGDMTWTSEDV